MANNRSICPRCNNYVEGRKISSFKGKTARTAAKALVKEGSKDIVEFGTIGAGAAAGAAIGSIIPGIGTAIGATIGGAAGWVGKALANDAIGKKVDQAADYLEDEYTEVVYQYTCPKCGHSWTSEDEDYEEDYEDYDEEEYDDDEDEDFRNEFNYYIENGELIVKDKNEVLKKVQDLENAKDIYSDIVKSEYSFLQSIYCLDYIL